jgi:hypothetical protein
MTQGEEQPDDPEGSDKPASKDERIAIAIDALKAAYEAKYNDSSEHQNKILTWTKAAAGGVFVYTALTLILTLISFCQLQTSRDNEKRQLRAYASPKLSLGGITNFAKSQDARLEIQLNNTGQTPAIDLGVNAILYFRKYPLPDTEDLTIPETPDHPIDGKGITLPPHAEQIGITLIRNIKPEMYDAAIEGKMARYYAFGIIRYRDIFSVEHWTHFCFSFYGEGLKQWDLCPRYNDADHNDD